MLCGARAAGPDGPLPIALSEFESYCWLTGRRDAEETAERIVIVQASDAAHLEVAARRSGEKKPFRRLTARPNCGVGLRAVAASVPIVVGQDAGFRSST